MQHEDVAVLSRERQRFIERLQQAGWSVTSAPGSLAGVIGPVPIASARHGSASLRQTLELIAPDGHLEWCCEASECGIVLETRLYPLSEKRAAVLEMLASSQSTIDETNLSELVKKLVPCCERVLIATDDGFVRAE